MQQPDNPEELGGWVQVLMAETSMEFVPEGLERHVKDPEKASLLSFTVLKQWVSQEMLFCEYF